MACRFHMLLYTRHSHAHPTFLAQTIIGPLSRGRQRELKTQFTVKKPFSGRVSSQWLAREKRSRLNIWRDISETPKTADLYVVRVATYCRNSPTLKVESLYPAHKKPGACPGLRVISVTVSVAPCPAPPARRTGIGPCNDAPRPPVRTGTP